ncbi:MAG: hypothetical protein Q4G27_07940 [Flavobacteriaceae bacterium]|nr:hypothetical protein [Flavobacteriaceae bacterium]
MNDVKPLAAALILATKLEPKNHEVGFIKVFGDQRYFAGNSYSINSVD